MRHEADGVAELLGDLRCVPVRTHGVRREVLEHDPRVRDADSDLPAPETPDFASITALSVTPASGPRASSAAVA
jgi:hypothetical protein